MITTESSSCVKKSTLGSEAKGSGLDSGSQVWCQSKSHITAV